ncbi:MAG: cytochrome c [Acidobacteriota bacterium]
MGLTARMAACAALIVAAAIVVAEAQAPARFGFGRPATPEEIKARDIDIMPDGTGLPPGRGTVSDGSALYAGKCARCHGPTGREGPNDVLVGREPREGFPFSANPKLRKSIGNYWPYASTVFDYVRRAMPPDAPGSLTDDEVYALVAFLLHQNELIAADAVMDAKTLPQVKMPAERYFVPDPRTVPGAAAKKPQE